MSTAVASEPVTVIQDLKAVDDAGSVHYESVWTARRIVEMHAEGLLRLEGNIRPDHMPAHKMGAKTRRKIDAWANELLSNNAVIGNISVRLDPKQSHFSLEEDEDGDLQLIVNRGYFDTAVDSESRIKAILMAAASQVGTFKPETRFAVRIWISSDDNAKRIAAIYNTRGDKVNDTAAKYAWQQTREQALARKFMEKSSHLGLDNIEVLSNTVSANSHKLAAFNTLSQAVEGFWMGEPLNESDLDTQSDFLVSFWDELVKVRPEYGRLTKAQRKKNRGTSISGTAVSIHGLIAAASTMFELKIDPKERLAKLNQQVDVDGELIDYFDYNNPAWVNAGVLVLAPDKDGNPRKQLRMSFQTRREMAAELRRKLSLLDIEQAAKDLVTAIKKAK
jgi:hypothetical protein